MEKEEFNNMIAMILKDMSNEQVMYGFGMTLLNGYDVVKQIDTNQTELYCKNTIKMLKDLKKLN